MASNFDLSEIQVSGAPGLDALFQREASIVTPAATGRRKVASLQDLTGFTRLSAETLIHKSNRDLWAIKQDGGAYFIERLFDDNGEPLKG